MSIQLSLKLDEKVFESTERIVKQMHMPRNAYINRAVDFFNRLQARKALAKTLRGESRKVASDSLSVLKTFESLEDELP